MSDKTHWKDNPTTPVESAVVAFIDLAKNPDDDALAQQAHDAISALVPPPPFGQSGSHPDPHPVSE